ncbi:uncharacterized protein LOC5518019 [Nematostella vectensis]|uniref:uncharacterized protein LOC5518019 n=1 Tax=Nematostella vectensis TaxID=45351 RepID=UPI002076E355|nr:uncharacterized protein LOC5518019 [Nematostella vectensis]
MLGLCLKQANVPLKAAAAPRAQSRQCPCGPGEYCHEKFNMCLPTPILPVVTTRASSLVSCKSDDDCSGNKYCHKIWNFCLEIPQIPTSVTRKTSHRQCTSDANCTSAEYCHDFFGCVQSRGFYCQLDQDCQSGQYCHNMTRVCLRTLGNSTHNGDRRLCVAHDDCKFTEFCGLLFDPRQASVVVRLRRKCSGSSNCARRSGVCVPHMSCDAGSCPANMFCVSTVNICMELKQQGHACVLQADSSPKFVSPCASGLVCRAVTKRRKRKNHTSLLAQKLRIPGIILRAQATQTWLKTPIRLGRCHAG